MYHIVSGKVMGEVIRNPDLSLCLLPKAERNAADVVTGGSPPKMAREFLPGSLGRC